MKDAERKIASDMNDVCTLDRQKLFVVRRGNNLEVIWPYPND